MGSLGHKSLKLVQVSQDQIWPVRIVQHIPFVRCCFWNGLQYWKKQMNNIPPKKCLAHNPWYSSNYGYLNTQKSSFFGEDFVGPQCLCVPRSRKCRSWDLSTFPSAFGQENLEKTGWNHGIWNLQNWTPRELNIQVYDRLIVVNLSKRDSRLWLNHQSHQVCHKNACDCTPFWVTYQSAWYCFITLGIAFQVFL